MKKLHQKLILFACCLLFAALLLLSIRYSEVRMPTGSILQPRFEINTLKTK